ncbi:MAG: orotate phosphoribosyltransferase [Acidimicrobiia bacterium]|nr:orotate phosphoribosyltransferase [Acidimicrobiia bacterium]
MDFFSASKNALIEHLRDHALRTDGPFALASGAVSSWYLDGRQTTFDGEGARRIAAAVLDVLDDRVTAVGGMTMGADPIAVATAVCADRPLKAFSVRKGAKDHGTGGRLVGPVGTGDRVCVVEDTMTTGASTVAAIEVLREAGIPVVQVITVVDRSDGAASAAMDAIGLTLTALVTPSDLGVPA